MKMAGIIKKPWGHERILSQTDAYVVKELYVKPNSSLSLQYHEEKVETMFLVSGQGFLHLDYSRVRGGPISPIRMEKLHPYPIMAGTIHRLYTEDEDCLVVEVSSTELDDVVRLKDEYGRV